MAPNLTAGEECSISAKVFNYFSDRAIPPSFVASCLGVAISKGTNGTAVVRLQSGEWSAPCAFALYSATTEIDPNQETVILFMSERAIIGLIKNETVILNQTFTFLPGPLNNENAPIEYTDMYVYVRYNNQFTPANLITAGMTGWQIGEDKTRHNRWHGSGVSWFDVLTNKISVDRSSVGNALYLLLAGKSKHKAAVKNFVETSKMVGPKPSDVAESAGIYNPPPVSRQSPQMSQQQIPQQQMAQQQTNSFQQLTPLQVMQQKISVGSQFQQPVQQYNMQQYGQQGYSNQYQNPQQSFNNPQQFTIHQGQQSYNPQGQQSFTSPQRQESFNNQQQSFPQGYFQQGTQNNNQFTQQLGYSQTPQMYGGPSQQFQGQGGFQNASNPYVPSQSQYMDQQQNQQYQGQGGQYQQSPYQYQ